MTTELNEEGRSQRKVDNMISIMNQLCALLKRENEALSKNKVRDIEKLVSPKIKVINVYAEQYQIFSNNPELISKLDDIRKKEIAATAQILQDLMSENERLLKANITSSRRLIDMIVEGAQRKEKEESGVYSASGSMGYGKKVHNANMSYNQVL